MTGWKRFAALGLAAFSLTLAAASAQAVRTDATLSYQMLKTESEVRNVTKAKFDLLTSVIEDAAAATGYRFTRPSTRKQAIEALDAIQTSMAKHNFIQPIANDIRRDTVGDAFEPLPLSREERLRLFAPGELNGFRARYIDPDRPIYAVGAEIGSQLIISVGQRMGWDIRLVQTPDHYFVRWYYTPSEYLNWDWTAGGPSRDEYYSIEGGDLYRDWPARRRYLRTLPQNYARANYLWLLSGHFPDTVRQRTVLERAIQADATHEGVQNALAWLYATDPVLRRNFARRAVAYALSAWAASPDDPVIADTVACAYAARGDRSLATQIERYAIARLRAARRPTAEYESRLRQIENGGACSATPSDTDDDEL